MNRVRELTKAINGLQLASEASASEMEATEGDMALEETESLTEMSSSKNNRNANTNPKRTVKPKEKVVIQPVVRGSKTILPLLS